MLTPSVLAADDLFRNEQVVVTGVTPMLGAAADRDKIPASTEAVTSQAIERTGGLLDALDATIGGIGLNHAQGNPFQPTVV